MFPFAKTLLQVAPPFCALTYTATVICRPLEEGRGGARIDSQSSYVETLVQAGVRSRPTRSSVGRLEYAVIRARVDDGGVRWVNLDHVYACSVLPGVDRPPGRPTVCPSENASRVGA